jgi:hypothetical protein
MMVTAADVRFIEPRELKRADGKRGIAVAYVKRDLFVISLPHDMSWIKHPQAGILLIHPQRRPLWCRFEGTTYVRSELELN